MLVLAITSYASTRKAMGKSWKLLHRTVYLSAVAAGAHVLYYQLKYPAMYIVGSRVYPAAFAVLLGLRAYWALPKAKAKAKSS